MTKTMIVLASCVIVTISQACCAGTVLTDSFDYTGWNSGNKPMNAGWTSIQNAPTIISGTSPYPTSYARINNGAVSANLDVTLTSDFTMKVNLLSTNYGRLHWFGITNDTGTQGYYVYWDTALASQYGSGGAVAIGKIDTSSSLSYSNPGTALSAKLSSGHNPDNTSSAATTPPFVEFTLTWTAATSTLILYVDNSKVCEVHDESFSSFSKIYLAGNGAGLYSFVSVTSTAIPEPASLSWIVPGIALLGCRAIRR